MFEGEVVYEYTDDQAVEDGVLADIGHLGLKCNGEIVNRATASVMYEARHAGVGDDADLAKWLGSLIATAVDNEGDGYLLVIATQGTTPKMWVVHNGQGYTIMLPEDY